MKTWVAMIQHMSAVVLTWSIEEAEHGQTTRRPTSLSPPRSFSAKPASSSLKETVVRLGSSSAPDINVLVTGTIGYISKFVVRGLCCRGFNVITIARDRSRTRGRDDKAQTTQQLVVATIFFSAVIDPVSLARALDTLGRPVDVVVCYLASRGGGISDSWKVDYGASRNSLLAGRRLGAAHFVLLSAICVQKPLCACKPIKWNR
ncbi:hypothetical protein Cni_G17439 [Canna indica]|uniref:Uncharacterized protein n=1 Tax=Canna indica TaxID=4628 RepID=A0AAQ3QGL2_9LILI|nr:hypothetical protein Cni_G17439 [Canna indica]